MRILRIPEDVLEELLSRLLQRAENASADQLSIILRCAQGGAWELDLEQAGRRGALKRAESEQPEVEDICRRNWQKLPKADADDHGSAARAG